MERILRTEDVVAITGLSRSTIYAQQALGKFPHNFPLTRRTVGWYSSEVLAWMEERGRQRGTRQ